MHISKKGSKVSKKGSKVLKGGSKESKKSSKVLKKRSKILKKVLKKVSISKKGGKPVCGDMNCWGPNGSFNSPASHSWGNQFPIKCRVCGCPEPSATNYGEY